MSPALAARNLYARWVLANTLGELLGLGATFAIVYGVIGSLAEQEGLTVAAVTAVLMVATGALEGVIVGAAQWWAMAPAFPGLTRQSWVKSTVIGAVVAWGIGTLPMVLGSVITSAGAAHASGLTEFADGGPSALTLVALQAAAGAIAGLVLAVAQWRSLRRFAPRAWRWLPANATAWAVGMPIVFESVNRAIDTASSPVAIATMAAGLVLAGAVVGAIHGVGLVALAGADRQESV